MKELIVRVIDDFDGFPSFLNGIVHEEMLRVYNVGADASGELYKQWNCQFDREFPDSDGYSEEYMRFIEVKWAEWYSKNVRSMIFDLSKTTMNSGAMPIFKLRGFPKSKATFCIEID